jgi:hypothetical protein
MSKGDRGASTAEQKRVQDALDEARRLLAPLSKDIMSWTEQGAGTVDPAKELRHAIFLVECLANDNILDGHSLAELVRKAAIPILKRARPATGQEGWRANSFALRDQVIAAAVDQIHRQYGFDPTRSPGHPPDKECACSIVAKALKKLGIDRPGEKTIATDIWPKYRP